MSGSRDDSQKSSAATQSATNAGNAQTNFGNQQALEKNLFGAGTGGAVSGTGGAVGSMLDPAKLNATTLSGPFQGQFNAATQNTANQYQGARGQLARYMATRGFGADSPSGMQSDAYGQLARGEADAQGQNFTQGLTNQYNANLGNFWNAANLESGQAANAGNLAQQGGTSAANTYANLYANSYTPSIWSSVLQGAGDLGLAAIPGGGAAKALPALKNFGTIF